MFYILTKVEMTVKSYAVLPLAYSLTISLPLYGSSLNKAAHAGDVQRVAQLIQAGADVNQEGTPLHAAIKGSQTDFVTKMGPLILEGNTGVILTLLRSTKSRYIEVVQALLQAKANANVQIAGLITPLHYAAINGCSEIAMALIKFGAKLELRTIWGTTPLHCAATQGHADIVNILLCAGSQVNVQDNYGRIPLYWAARNGHTNIVQMLIRAGSDIDTPNDIGESPVHETAQNYSGTQKNKSNIVRMLFSLGACLPDITQIRASLPTADQNRQAARQLIKDNAYVAHRWTWSVRNTLLAREQDTQQALPPEIVQLICNFATNAEPKGPKSTLDWLYYYCGY